MKKYFEDKKLKLLPDYFKILLIFAFYFLFNFQNIFLGTINLEWVFLDLANNFNNYDSLFNLNSFKKIQLNTSFYSNYISLFKINYTNNLIIIRSINLINVLVFLIFFFKILKIYNIKNKSLISLSLLISPFISINIVNLTPDFFTLTLFLIFFYFYKTSKNSFLIFTFFSFTTIMKPLILTQSFFFFLKEKSFEIKNLIYIFCIIFFSLTLLYLYIVFIDKNLINIEISNSYHYTIDYFYSNLLIYLSNIIFFMGIPSLVIFIFFCRKKNNKKIIFFTIVSLISVFFLKLNYGEVSIGFLQFLLFNDKIKYIFYFFSILACLFNFDYILRNNEIDNKIKFLLFACILSVILISVIIPRPSLRYLLYVFPFFLVIFYANITKKVLIYNFIFLLILSHFQNLYLVNRDNVERNIMKFLNTENIVEKTNPKIMYHSKGYNFKDFTINRYVKNKNITYEYLVNNCENKDYKIIKKFNIKIYKFTVKKYCIYKI